MSPTAYQQAQQQATKETDCFIIDDHPYFPLAVVDPLNLDTILQVVENILLHPIHQQQQHHHADGCVAAATTTNGTHHGAAVNGTHNGAAANGTHNGATNGIKNGIKNGSSSTKSLHSSSSSWTIEKVSGGITNVLFRVGNIPQHICQHENILVRLFGGHGMIDRDVENATFAALAKDHIAPPYLGRFANGRLEGWMDHMRPLTVRELSLPPIVHGVAKELAHMHYDFRVMPEQLQAHHPLDHPSMWKQLHEWMQQALVVLATTTTTTSSSAAATTTTTEKGVFRTEHDAQRAQALQLSTIPHELQWLRETQIPPDAVVVFCHNDLLAANILYNDETAAIQLIDFEYGGINYRSFDIANHFNEYAGGPPTDPHPHYEWFPSEAVQREFVTTYLTTTAALSSSNGNGNAGSDNHHDEHKHQYEHHHDEMDVTAKVDALLNELHGFVLANHLYWGLWAVNQAATEGCETFDYMEYAHNRFAQYWILKKEGASTKSE